jgi:hypothetical protein
MPAPSQTEIVNIALAHLKQRKIANLTESSVQAVEANRCYETARRETLRSHDWGFATVVKALVLNATYAVSSTGIYAGKWLYAYTYPSNAVAVWHVYSESTADKDNGEQFRIIYDPDHNQRIILTDCYQALGEYTFDVQDTTMFDANFVTAFACRLAFDMAPNLTGDDQVAGEMLKLFNMAISEAERMSSYEAYDDSRKKTTSTYEDIR